MKVVNDRRRASRVAARGEVYLHTKHGPVLGRCLDLSLGGASIEVVETKRIAGRVRMVTSFDGRLLDVDCVVARRRRAGSRFRLGLRFDGRERPVPASLPQILQVLQVHAGLARQAGALAERLPQLVPIGPQIPVPGAMLPLPVPSPIEVAPSAPIPRPVAHDPSTPLWIDPVPSTPLPTDGLVPFGADEGWREEELETTQYQGPPLDGSPRRTLAGAPGPARTGHTVVAPLPAGPARTGATVLSPRVELDDDDFVPTGRSARRGRRR